MNRILSLLIYSMFIVFYSCSSKDVSVKKKAPDCIAEDSLPYTLSHYPLVKRGNEFLMIGGIANDSITSTSLSYDYTTHIFTVKKLPLLPKKLMSGFAFKINDSIYYGGGYTLNWNNNYTPHLDTISSIFYTSALAGFAAGDSGRVFSTTNSGVNWIPTYIPSKSSLKSIKFYDANTGWIVSDSSVSKVFKTTTSGSSWDAGTVIGNGRMSSLSFVNQSTGWAAGSSGKIYRTTNGGASWDSVTRKSFNNLNSIFFVNSNSGWVCGENGRILKTTDGGTNWDTLKLSTNNLYSICFKDASTGYIAGSNGTLARTTNGGNIWSIEDIPCTQTLRSIDIKDSNIVICGDGGSVLCSTNGTKWERIYGITPNNLRSICIIPEIYKTAISGSNGFTSYSNRGCFEYTISSEVYARKQDDFISGWSARTDLPIPISEVFCSSGALNDTSAYVIGGKTSNGDYSDKIFRYCSKTGKWTSCTKLPSPRGYGGVAVVSNKSMLFIGGINSVDITEKMYKISLNSTALNPDSLIITFKANYPAGPVYGMGAIGTNLPHRGIFAGGMNDKQKVIDVIATTNTPYSSFKIWHCKKFENAFIPLIEHLRTMKVPVVCCTETDDSTGTDVGELTDTSPLPQCPGFGDAPPCSCNSSGAQDNAGTNSDFDPNISCFRNFVINYMNSHPEIKTDESCMVPSEVISAFICCSGQNAFNDVPERETHLYVYCPGMLEQFGGLNFNYNIVRAGASYILN